jgi:hypothetical protein
MLRFCQEQDMAGMPIEAVCVWHPNRFSRADSQETSWFIWEFRQAGVRRMFTASNGWIDFSRMEDRVLFNIVQDTSNHRFTLDLAQACTRGRLDAAREGRPISECPFGYAKEYEEITVPGKGKRRRPKRLVPGDPAEVEVVRWLFTQYATTTTSLYRLAAELNARGVRPPKRARVWRAVTVRAILRNEVYVGVPAFGRRQFGKFFRLSGGRIVPAESRRIIPVERENWVVPDERHEPLIDQATFDVVQGRLVRNRQNTGPDPEDNRPLRGLVTCANCGARMVGRRQKFRSRVDGRLIVHRRLICGSYNNSGKAGCSHNTVDEEGLVLLLLRKLVERFLADDARRALEEEIAARLAETEGSGRAEAERLRAEVDARAAQIKQAARRLLTEEEALLPALREQLRVMQQEHDRLATRLASLGSAPSPAADVRARAERAAGLVRRLVELWRLCDPAALREVFREMVAGVELHFEATTTKGGHQRSRLLRGVVRFNEDYTLIYCSR